MAYKSSVPAVPCEICGKPTRSMYRVCKNGSKACSQELDRRIYRKIRGLPIDRPDDKCLLCGGRIKMGGRVGICYRDTCKRMCQRIQKITLLYDITTREYLDLLESHDGRCYLCGDPITEEVPDLDHDHDSGAIRGLTHGLCNLGIGALGDDPRKIRRVADALEERMRELEAA